MNNVFSIKQLALLTEKKINEADILDLHTAFMHITADELRMIQNGIHSDNQCEVYGKAVMMLLYRYFQKEAQTEIKKGLEHATR